MAAAMFSNVTTAFGRSKNSQKHDRSDSFNKAKPATTLDTYSNGDGNGGARNTQRNGAYNAADPVSMHLLMENALEDSNNYEVLAPDDVDDARRELDGLAGRIEATQRKLALESKVRDASKTMNRLDKIEEANEAAARCEELGQELFRLERQEQQLQRRLLEHTAGVLQMTHKGYLKDGPDQTADEFGQSHLYEPSMLLDSLEGSGKPSAEQQQLISDVQSKIEVLNGKIRAMLLDLHPAPQDMPGPVPQARGEDAEGFLLNQVSYLDGCFTRMQRAQKAQQAVTGQSQELTRALGDINNRLYQTVTRNGTDQDFKLVPPPPVEDGSAQAQVDYISRVNECMQMHLEKTDKYDSVVGGLWEVLAVPDQDGDFSLQKFSAKVQEMNVKFSSVQEQKAVLTRQIQQQRELNESGDADKDKQFKEIQGQLDDARADLAVARQGTNDQVEKLTAAVKELEAKTEAATKTENELREMESRYIETQTELTFTKAELDGAHGSRAERAAEAANPQLQERVKALENELRETITDYEAMTKASIEHEKEREQLESLVDGLRDRVESLEAQLNEEKIAAMGVKSPGGTASGGTSASVLRNEFKKMMKDARDQHQKTLKAEQEERRKLEAQVRTLKKEALAAKGK